jgi:hypothetical protein
MSAWVLVWWRAGVSYGRCYAAASSDPHVCEGLVIDADNEACGLSGLARFEAQHVVVEHGQQLPLLNYCAVPPERDGAGDWIVVEVHQVCRAGRHVHDVAPSMSSSSR